MSTTVDSPVVALRAINIPRSYGMLLYEVETNQDIILSDPSLSVYRDWTHAEKSVTRGSRTFAGMNRVFKGDDIPYGVRNRISQLRGYSSHPHLVVLDTPVVMDSAHPSEISRALEIYQHLPCLTKEVRTAVVSTSVAFPSKKSTLWGLPSISRPRYTKAGLPYKKPGKAISAKIQAWLHAHLADTDLRPLHTTFLTSLNELFIRKMPYSHRYSTHQYRVYALHVSISGYVHSDFDKRQSHTSSMKMTRQADYASCVTYTINSLLSMPRTGSGFLRSPIIYLRKFHSDRVRELLSTYYPLLSRVRNFPTETDKKICNNSYHLHHAAKEWQGLAKALMRFSRAMGYPSFPRPTASPSPLESDPHD